jgi:hypothetical protein
MNDERINSDIKYLKTDSVKERNEKYAKEGRES